MSGSIGKRRHGVVAVCKGTEKRGREGKLVLYPGGLAEQLYAQFAGQCALATGLRHDKLQVLLKYFFVKCVCVIMMLCASVYLQS